MLRADFRVAGSVRAVGSYDLERKYHRSLILFPQSREFRYVLLRARGAHLLGSCLAPLHYALAGENGKCHDSWAEAGMIDHILIYLNRPLIFAV
jgi:hypothetical protein